MKNTRSLIRGFLKESGITQEPIVAGGVTKSTPQLSRDKIDRLMGMLEKSRDQNAILAYGVLFLHIAVLLAAIFFAWSRLQDTNMLTGILSVGSGILFATIISFRSFWREKTVMDLLLAILPGATPDEALKVLLATLDQKSK